MAGLRGEGRDGVGEKGGGEEEAIVCIVSPLDAGVTERAVGVVLVLVGAGAGTGIGGAGGLRRRGGGGGGGLLLVPRLSRSEAGVEMARVDADTDIAGSQWEFEGFSSVVAAVGTLGTGEGGNDNSGIVGDMASADRDRTGCAR